MEARRFAHGPIEEHGERVAKMVTARLHGIGRYLDTLGLDEGWLVLFDLRSTLPWEQRLTTRAVEVGGKRVHVVGC